MMQHTTDPTDSDDVIIADDDDLAELGMTVKDVDSDEELEDETVASVPGAVDDVTEVDLPVDGLALLDALEGELNEEPPDIGEEEEEG